MSPITRAYSCRAPAGASDGNPINPAAPRRSALERGCPEGGLTGSCLCGAVRYKILFPRKDDWPPTPATCECDNCRKWTASLIAQFLMLNDDQVVTWKQTGVEDPLTEYESPGPHRILYRFCNRCGSCLAKKEYDDTVEVFVGTLDPRWLKHELRGSDLEEPVPFQVWLEKSIDLQKSAHA